MVDVPMPEPDVWSIGSIDGREEVHSYSEDALRAYAAQVEAATRADERALLEPRIEALSQKLHDMEARYWSLLRQVADGVAQRPAPGIVLQASDEAIRALGQTREQG